MIPPRIPAFEGVTDFGNLLIREFRGRLVSSIEESTMPYRADDGEKGGNHDTDRAQSGSNDPLDQA